MDLELLLAAPSLEELITECLYSAEYCVLSCVAVKVRNTLIRPAPWSILAAHADLRGKSFRQEGVEFPLLGSDDGDEASGSQQTSR